MSSLHNYHTFDSVTIDYSSFVTGTIATAQDMWLGGGRIPRLITVDTVQAGPPTPGTNHTIVPRVMVSDLSGTGEGAFELLPANKNNPATASFAMSTTLNETWIFWDAADLGDPNQSFLWMLRRHLGIQVTHDRTSGTTTFTIRLFD